MKIPETFKQVIADTFYDKELKIMTNEKEEVIDDEGCIIETERNILKEIIMGNFQFSTLEKVQQEYGKEIIAECIVTCEDTKATADDILIYQDKEYEIKAIIPCDSHKTILLHRVGGLDEQLRRIR